MLQLIENNPALLLSETFGGTSFNMMVAPISVNCSNRISLRTLNEGAGKTGIETASCPLARPHGLQ
jgi:hypothetical protein